MIKETVLAGLQRKSMAKDTVLSKDRRYSMYV